MNKSVIIDDCNVAECQQLVIKKSGKHYCYDYFNGFCEDNKDCYYKQLQRLKKDIEELEELKESNDSYDKAVRALLEDNDKLKAENEKLKAPSMIIPQVGKLGVPIEQYCKLKQALEKIREITKKYYLSDKKLLATGIEINPYGAIIEIQDKVNEVLKDE